MAGAKSDLGPTGETVRANIKRFREARNLTFAELSRRLDQVGRPIPPLGLRRAEEGNRKIDVDDLTALAEVFGVAPVGLLVRQDDSLKSGDLVEVTGPGQVTAGEHWAWLTGDANHGEQQGWSWRLDSMPRWRARDYTAYLERREAQLRAVEVPGHGDD